MFLKKIIFVILLASSVNAADKKKSETIEFLNLFGDVFYKVKKDYVNEPSDKELIESAINGMLTSLDPHSGYMNAKAFSEMSIYTKGEFGGLGIEITMENGIIRVISPIEGTPAFNANIKNGDYIVSIDDEAVMGMSLNDAVEKMRGKPGTKIHLTIIRENTNEPLEFDIVREKIKFKAVRASIESQVGYLKINSFTENVTEEAENEIKKFKEALGNNLKGIILDLRNNPGGLLLQAVEFTDLFLDRGEIVSTRGRKKEDMVRYNAHSGDIINNLPMVILINNGTASAPEIVAGALQDHKRAMLLGTKSFGKGSVQSVMPIGEYGAVKLTTARYYTPSGRSIQAEGIVPDIIVEQAKIEHLEAKDPKKLYSEANLKRHLENEKKENSVDKSNLILSNKDLKPNESQKDYQLIRALDLIKAIDIFKKK